LKAQEEGLRVRLQVFPVVNNWQYSGNWATQPRDVETWCHSYGEQVLHYATIGEANGVEAFVIGVELSGMLDSIQTSQASRRKVWSACTLKTELEPREPLELQVSI
jgi:hypothetical protein